MSMLHFVDALDLCDCVLLYESSLTIHLEKIKPFRPACSTSPVSHWHKLHCCEGYTLNTGPVNQLRCVCGLSSQRKFEIPTEGNLHTFSIHGKRSRLHFPLCIITCILHICLQEQYCGSLWTPERTKVCWPPSSRLPANTLNTQLCFSKPVLICGPREEVRAELLGL